jgi:pyruvate carboxylase
MEDRDEIAVDIERGKTIILAVQGRTDVDEDGYVRLFFELNGQPRPVRIRKAGVESAEAARERAEAGNPAHVGAPMPGSIVMVSVTTGQPVAKGDPLVSIEAMKMETMLRAERDGLVTRVLVKPGDTIAAKDLLLEITR